MPAGGAPASLSCGVVVVKRSRAEIRCLLLRAYRNWDFPKGLVEPGETPFDAAIREVREETTLDDLSFDWGADFVETAPYNKGKIARFYLARTETSAVRLPINPLLGRPEHHEARWASFDEASGMVVPRLGLVLRWASAVIGA